jgi:hypothetical protein
MATSGRAIDPDLDLLEDMFARAQRRSKNKKIV